MHDKTKRVSVLCEKTAGRLPRIGCPIFRNDHGRSWESSPVLRSTSTAAKFSHTAAKFSHSKAITVWLLAWGDHEGPEVIMVRTGDKKVDLAINLHNLFKTNSNAACWNCGTSDVHVLWYYSHNHKDLVVSCKHSRKCIMFVTCFRTYSSWHTFRC